MPHIRARNLSVDFPIYQGASRRLLRKSLFTGTRVDSNLDRDSLQRLNVHALKNVSLDIEDGQRVAVLGVNGAGKSTLLRVLAGIYEPVRGYVDIDGQISALLDTSVGLNPESTGYENIIRRGMFMDIYPSEMRKRLAEVGEFTELGHYLDMPVRTYSAGMMVRLSFAIATCVQPEVLLMDEWLGAGDTHFLVKAQKRMETFIGKSSIMVLASHSMSLLKEWCNRGILLDRGQIVASGTLSTVIAAYDELQEAAAKTNGAVPVGSAA